MATILPPLSGSKSDSKSSSKAEFNKPSQPVSLHSTAIRETLQAREEYFASLSPEALESASAFQIQIDESLAKAGSLHNRMVVLSEMMLSNQLRMMSEMKRLRGLCQDLCENLKER